MAAVAGWLKPWKSHIRAGVAGWLKLCKSHIRAAVAGWLNVAVTCTGKQMFLKYLFMKKIITLQTFEG